MARRVNDWSAGPGERVLDVADHFLVAGAAQILVAPENVPAKERVEGAEAGERYPKWFFPAREREEMILPVEVAAVRSVCIEWMMSGDDHRPIAGRLHQFGEPVEEHFACFVR